LISDFRLVIFDFAHSAISNQKSAIPLCL